MWRAALAGFLGACGFSATNVSPGSSESTVDARGADASPLPSSEFCGPTAGAAQGHVMACFEFDDTADDGSSHHLAAHTDNVAFVAGQVGRALSFTDTSNADFDDSAAFDADSLTIELWIHPTALPLDTVNLLDVDNQYAFQLKTDGDLGCKLIGGKSIDANVDLAPAVWHHVACTYDAASGRSVIYVDGSQRNDETGDPDKPLSRAGTTGLSLAADNPPPPAGSANRARMVGLLDQVRLLDYARSADDICADSGSQACP